MKALSSSLVDRAALAVLVVFVALGCAGCGPRIARVKDITKNETIILHVKSASELPSSLSVAGGGAIVGQAEVQLIMNSAIYQRASLSGPVNFEWHVDWYEKQAELRYVAGTATSGHVTLRYEFRPEL